MKHLKYGRYAMNLNNEMLTTTCSTLKRTITGVLHGKVTGKEKGDDDKMHNVYEWGPVKYSYVLDYKDVTFAEILDGCSNTHKISKANNTRPKGEAAARDLNGKTFSLRAIIDSARVSATQPEKAHAHAMKLDETEKLELIRKLQASIGSK